MLKTRALKIGAVFIGIMLFFTYTSKTFLYLMTPKVVLAHPEAMAISNVYNFNGAEYYFENAVDIKLPSKLKTPITVKNIVVSPLAAVKAGDELIHFDTSAYDDIVKNLELQVETNNIEYTQFTKDYTERISQTNKDISDTKTQLEQLDHAITYNYIKTTYEQSIKDRDALLSKTTKLESELHYLETTGILNNKSMSLLQRKLQDAQKELQAAKETIEAAKVLKAPADGIVTSLGLKAGDKYDGNGILLQIAPANKKLQYAVKITDEQTSLLKTNMPCSINVKGNTTKGKIIAIKEFMGIQHVIIEPEKEITENPINFNISIEIKSATYGIVLPNSAFFESDKVFVVKHKRGWFGDELYVSSQSVTKGEGNERYTAITAGITRGESVVVGSDKEIKNGARVIEPLK